MFLCSHFDNVTCHVFIDRMSSNDWRASFFLDSNQKTHKNEAIDSGEAEDPFHLKKWVLHNAETGRLQSTACKPVARVWEFHISDLCDCFFFLQGSEDKIVLTFCFISQEDALLLVKSAWSQRFFNLKSLNLYRKQEISPDTRGWIYFYRILMLKFLLLFFNVNIKINKVPRKSAKWWSARHRIGFGEKHICRFTSFFLFLSRCMQNDYHFRHSQSLWHRRNWENYLFSWKRVQLFALALVW